MDTHLLINIGIHSVITGILIYDWYKIYKLGELVEMQQELIFTQHRIIKGAIKKKQEKCCGSTSDSKPESQGSTPCSCEVIIKELDK